MKEFASALSKLTPTAAWEPEMQRFALLKPGCRVGRLESPPLEIRRFPLQRGYARAPLRWMMPFAWERVRQMKSDCDARESPLVCSTPFYAPVAERWPGPVVYYSTDLTFAYDGLDAAQVRGLDKRLCRAAAIVCPNSRRIADYFVNEAGCDPAKITVVPNATRESNVMAEAPRGRAGELPEDLLDLKRPIAGVLGDLSGNMDWLLTRRVMELTPELNWVFVGPTTRAIADTQQNAAREWAMARARFTGLKPYGELQRYARCFDVAVLPYRRKEPTYSGSSTRFYEHLAACRPMVATRGFAELLEKVPLVSLADTAEEVVDALRVLAAKNFEDGLEQARWKASRVGTWEERARVMVGALDEARAPEAPAESGFGATFTRDLERRDNLPGQGAS